MRNRYLLARAVLLRHLKAHLKASHPNVQVHQFESPLDSNFQKYLNACGAYFIMTHDGANTTPIEKDPLLKRLEQDKFALVEDEELHRRKVFRASILAFITNGYNVALVNGLEWQDTKVVPPTSKTKYASIDNVVDHDHGCRRRPPKV